MQINRTFTKADLCEIFGLVSPSGTNYYHKLRNDYFTDDALKELNISPERYRSIRGMTNFNYFESLRIRKLFDIRDEELIKKAS